MVSRLLLLPIAQTHWILASSLDVGRGASKAWFLPPYGYANMDIHHGNSIRFAHGKYLYKIIWSTIGKNNHSIVTDWPFWS